MPAYFQLTPEQIAAQIAAERAAQTTSGGSPYFGAAINGTNFGPSYSNDPSGGEGGTNTLAGWTANQGSNVGDYYDVYGADGNFTGTQQYTEDKWYKDPLLWAALATMGGMGAFLPGGFMAGAGTGAVGGAGGFIGEGALSGVGAWDAALAGATPGMGAAGAGAGAMSGGGGIGTLSKLPLMDAGILADGTAALGPASTMGGGSGLGGLLGKYGGLAATGLGALAGSQGQEQNQSSTRKMDPRLDPYYFGGQGQQGLLPMAMGLLQQQQSPEKMAQWDKMSNIGMGLLSKPRVQYFGGR